LPGWLNVYPIVVNDKELWPCKRAALTYMTSTNLLARKQMATILWPGFILLVKVHWGNNNQIAAADLFTLHTNLSKKKIAGQSACKVYL
jgi:hypothetical protein